MRPLLILATILIAGFAVPAHAQMPCMDRQKLVTNLGAKYSETKQGWGIGSNQYLYEVFSSPNGTWTFIVTAPGGPTCLVMSGQNWDGSREPNQPKNAAQTLDPM
ncbi:MAG: hypothetical protein HOM25_05665 [Rhodospirillaceae bacterium]|jgi:hypothetical protein|nr:hypothetical protein [Rhodospirillaceae bacterium]MBT5812459.1 hypothetical protein [Rhodospirillaceae bacterium]